eukprot:Blabericola_migrator_1__6935@NODE_3513_length_1717_cov_7_342424_g2181_i0_p1_GENE_NODE_3513_length_1717_cov_7_342424_g2181_i0NODE_3513_length_1717_cov_7_342424_g2181_i0_p1_ORF_typecomplete_len347_score41_80AP2/PF00847_20/9_1e03AP2/PF00847_20/5_5e03AP2/PF00847_20/0_038_NODE_3513_length_1717_cov_7_342424_g2181_i0371077
MSTANEHRQKSDLLRPWAKGVRWAEDDSGWAYSALTTDDEVTEHYAPLAEHGWCVEKAYIAAVRAHRAEFRAVAERMSVTLPPIKNVTWASNMLSWRLEQPRGSYRFFPVETDGVAAAWSRAVAASQGSRKRKSCCAESSMQPLSKQPCVTDVGDTPVPRPVVKMEMTTTTTSSEMPQADRISQWHERLLPRNPIADSFIDPTRTTILQTSNSHSTETSATPVVPVPKRPGRPSIASTRASASSIPSPSESALQTEAVSLLPYPPGIIWARTTQRWFAIYKEDGSRRKKFKTFDPKKYDGDCSQAFHAAIDFLSDKEAWVTRRSETTLSTQDGVSDVAAFPIGGDV